MRKREGIFLPEKIRCLTAGKSYRQDEIGMSGSCVLIYEDRVLKIQQHNAEAENEYRMMQYLQGRLPVPAVYAYEVAEGRSYLLMSRCDGQMACSGEYDKNTGLLCQLLADSLKRLWSVDISGCASDQRLSYKLAQAAYRVENGLVDVEHVEPDTFGKEGFRDPEALLQWLYDNAPQEEPVLSHGDLCPPNIFGVHNKVSGYIDLGRAGIADKWCDIALCYRSLPQNATGENSGKCDGEICGQRDGSMFFRELGLQPDWQKIRYYILLDELF